MDRYIGLDAHTSSCTVATIGQSGKRLHSQVVETNAEELPIVEKVEPEPFGNGEHDLPVRNVGQEGLL